MDGTAAWTTLRTFRAALYACFTRRRDALFELADALLTGSPVSAPVHRSLEPVHRRGWGSLYAALARGRIDTPVLQALVARTAPPAAPPVFAVDVSVWPRCDAETSPERGFSYHPSRHSAGQPIVAGWAYQWVAQLGFARDSWTAPLHVRRVHPTENAHAVAAAQVRALFCTCPDAAGPPLFVFDAGSDPEWLARELGDAPVAVLVRLRRGRCFYADPPPAPPSPKGGRPRRHGAKFVCDDPATWPAPTNEHCCEDGQYGHVRVRAWAELHARSQNHPARGSRRPRPVTRGTVVLVEVERVPQKTRAPQQLWLAGAQATRRGPGAPDLALLWRAYVRRFDLEHTIRFVKQTLGWTLPRVRHPEQADRWTWLVVAAYTQLRLARACVADRRLPWERPSPAGALTPYRVRRAFSALLLAVGTPANPPQPCGRSPGRPTGCRSGPAPRFPALKKTA
jgi:hypothetical protein